MKIKQLRLRFAFYRLEQYLKKIRDKEYTPKELLSDIYSKKLSLIQPWQYEMEYLQLLEHYHSLKPKYVMEIGTANGGTLFSSCKLAQKNATIISVDLPGGKFGGGYPEWKIGVYEKFAKSGQSLHLVRASSYDPLTLVKVKEILKNNQLDYIFIDGDHTYEGVKKDFDMYLPLVKKGGTIVFHDIAIHENSGCKVDEFWRDIKKDFQHYEFVKDKNGGKFGIGVLIK